MKFLSISGLVAGASAFPHLLDLEALDGIAAKRLEGRATAAPQGSGAMPSTPPPFDAKSQYVSNQGQYAFVAPGAGDERGECPGLNAMANHGYLPHNGVATIQQFIDATGTVFGMGQDLAGFLAVYGALVDGNGLSWSIGGMPRTGILGSHNDYETDSSPIKSDLNQYGSNTKFVMSQFYNLYNRQPDAATANYNLDVLGAFRGDRIKESISKNPYYAYLPFTGIAVSQAAFTFIYRFMSNKSAEYPEGILNKAVLKSFMSVTGPEDNLTHTPGYEAIPDDWYKRNPSDDYTIPYFISDINYIGQTQPEIYQTGCNQGKVNTYSQFDPSQLTNGAYNAQQVAANPFCYASEFAIAEFPLISGLDTSSTALAPLVSRLKSYTSSLNCASISSVNQSALSSCPGFSVYGGPQGQVAPGAIQS